MKRDTKFILFFIVIGMMASMGTSAILIDQHFKIIRLLKQRAAV